MPLNASYIFSEQFMSYLAIGVLSFFHDTQLASKIKINVSLFCLLLAQFNVIKKTFYSGTFLVGHMKN